MKKFWNWIHEDAGKAAVKAAESTPDNRRKK